jgi:spore maturation protein CgeB
MVITVRHSLWPKFRPYYDDRVRAFRSLGYDVLEIDSEADSATIVDRVTQFDPGFVLVLKGQGLMNESMRILHEKYIMVFFMMDTFRKTLSMRNFDIVLCANLRSARLLKGEFLFETYDKEVNRKIDIDKKYNATFIGKSTIKRKPWLKGVKIFTGCYSEEHNKVVNQSRVNINIGGISDRVYKILGSGGFLLTRDNKEIRRLFTVGRDLDVFSTKGELREKIGFYLKNDKIRESIAEAGNITVQQYSSIEWAKAIHGRVQEFRQRNEEK